MIFSSLFYELAMKFCTMTDQDKLSATRPLESSDSFRFFSARLELAQGKVEEETGRLSPAFSISLSRLHLDHTFDRHLGMTHSLIRERYTWSPSHEMDLETFLAKVKLFFSTLTKLIR